MTMTLRTEFAYRIRTAVAYGIFRGKAGERSDPAWVQNEIDGAVTALASAQTGPEAVERAAAALHDATWRQDSVSSVPSWGSPDLGAGYHLEIRRQAAAVLASLHAPFRDPAATTGASAGECS